jgi:hypothetical protein
VIPKNEDQRQAPKKIDARVASVQHGSGLYEQMVCRGRRAAGWCTPCVGRAQVGGICKQLQSLDITECLRRFASLDSLQENPTKLLISARRQLPRP